MAGNSESETRTHERSYDLFTAIMKWGTILTAIAVLIVVLLIA